MDRLRKKAEFYKKEYNRIKKEIAALEDKRSGGTITPIELMRINALQEDRQKVLEKLKNIGK